VLVPANGHVYTASGAACVFLDNRCKQMLVERLDNAMISMYFGVKGVAADGIDKDCMSRSNLPLRLHSIRYSRLARQTTSSSISCLDDLYHISPHLFVACSHCFLAWIIGNMHISLIGVTVSLLCASTTAFTPASTSGTDKLNDHGMTNLKTYLHKNRGSNTCSLDTAVKRQEWYAHTSPYSVLDIR
jgi:hypothetical protein